MLKKISPSIFFASIIILYLAAKYFIVGITTLPSEGDSLHIHIPIAKAILSGTIFSSKIAHLFFYPGASEMLLSLFLFLSIPLNLYNWFGIVVLFFVVFFLGRKFSLSFYASFFYSFSLCTLYGIIRYVDSQKIDIWLLIFYGLSMFLLKKPAKTIRYFFLLGVCVGMVIGSKYSGPFFALFLCIFFWKKIKNYLSLIRVVCFLIPVVVFGFSWYIRNLLWTGNPLYPQPLLFFPGIANAQFASWPYWKVLVFFPIPLVNALISEYTIWSILFLVIPFSAIILYKNKLMKDSRDLRMLLWLSMSNLVIFLLTPAPPEHGYTSLVFGIRYSYPFMLTGLLWCFLVIQKLKKEHVLVMAALLNGIGAIFFVPYHPKILFVLIPFFVGGILLIEKMFAKKRRGVID